jgi:hypothetical protein
MLFLFTYWSSYVVVVVYTVQYLPDVVDEAAIAASHILQVGPHTNSEDLKKQCNKINFFMVKKRRVFKVTWVFM